MGPRPRCAPSTPKPAAGSTQFRPKRRRFRRGRRRARREPSRRRHSDAPGPPDDGPSGRGRGADGLAADGRSRDRWGGDIDTSLLSGAEWAANLFGRSETAVALLTSPPGRAHENVLTNDDIASARDIIGRYAGHRSRAHAHDRPSRTSASAERDAMAEWSDTLQPSGWKVYTLWEPPGLGAGAGWFLDDDETGGPFLEQVRASGRTIVSRPQGPRWTHREPRARRCIAA